MVHKMRSLIYGMFAAAKLGLSRGSSEFLVGLVLPHLPWLALSLLFLRNSLQGGLRVGTRERHWFVVWIGLMLPVLVSCVVRQRFSEALLVFGSFVFFVVMSVVLQASRTIVILTACLNLFLFSIAGRVQLQLLADSFWSPTTNAVISNWLGGSDQVFGSGGGMAKRTWVLNDVNRVRLDFQARYVGPWMDWDWQVSQPGFNVQRIQHVEDGFVRIKFPIGSDPYVFRVFDTGRPIALRTFRVTLELRTAESLPVSGCRGVWLQEAGGSFQAKCVAVPLGKVWTIVTFDWTVPPGKNSPTAIRIVLNDFDSLELDVRKVKIDELVQSRFGLKSESIQKPQVLLSSNLDATRVSFVPLELSHAWKLYRLELPVFNLAQVSAFVGISDSSFEFKHVVLTSPSGHGQISATAPLDRIALWFGHPNLFGHLIVLLGFAAMVLSNRWTWFVASYVFCAFALVASGSRTAWLALVVFGPLVAWFAAKNWMFQAPWKDVDVRWARVFTRGFSVLLIASSFALPLLSGGIGRLSAVNFSASQGSGQGSLFSDGNPVSRPEIWNAALNVLRENPFGLGEGQFGQWFDIRYPGVAGQVAHAHQFWLEFVVRYGWLGLIGSIVFTVGLIRMVRLFVIKEDIWRAYLLLAPILTMNSLDFTLFHPSILSFLIFALNSMMFVREPQVIIERNS